MSNTEFFQLFGMGLLGIIFLAFWITYRIRACQIRKDESGQPIVTRPRVKKWVKK